MSLLTNPSNVVELLKNSRVFSTLPDDAIRDLATKSRIEKYNDRTILCQRGEYPLHIRYVISGGIDVVLTTPSGGYSSLPIFPKLWFSWVGCMGSGPMIHDMWAIPGAQYLALPRLSVQAAVKENPAALIQVIEEISILTRFLTGCVLSYAAFTPEQRIVYLLLLSSADICGLTAEGQPTHLTQTHISQFGFGTRQRVARLLKLLADKNLIEINYGRISIPSRLRLVAYLSDDAPSIRDAVMQTLRA